MMADEVYGLWGSEVVKLVERVKSYVDSEKHRDSVEIKFWSIIHTYTPSVTLLRYAVENFLGDNSGKEPLLPPLFEYLKGLQLVYSVFPSYRPKNVATTPDRRHPLINALWLLRININ
jgi:hypothetical protein